MLKIVLFFLTFAFIQGAFSADDLLWFQKRSSYKANWSQSGIPYAENDVTFRGWGLTDKKRIPGFNTKLSLNCWEYVLYTAYRNREIDKKFIQSVYKNRDYTKPFQPLMAKNDLWRIPYKVENGKVKLDHSKAPKKGDLIFLDGASHVVQATGRITKDGVEVVSFSPLPIWGDGQVPGGKGGVKPEVTTIEAIIQNLYDLYPDSPVDWNDIKIDVGTPLWKGDKESEDCEEPKDKGVFSPLMNFKNWLFNRFK